MTFDENVKRLVQYGIESGLVPEEERIYTTNQLLEKNAELLKTNTLETAKESERGIVDIETLKKTNADLIQTLDDVMRIQKEGRIKRQQAEVEMQRMEAELKSKLLEIRK